MVNRSNTAHKVALTSVEDKIQILSEYFNNDSNVSFALIFGSYASGRQTKLSDLDIAIYFDNPPDGLDLLSLINTISDLIGIEVDLAVLNNASAFLRHQVMKNYVALTIKDRVNYRRFREKTITDYDEYKFISGINIYDR